jgi:hypothetical protein
MEQNHDEEPPLQGTPQKHPIVNLLGPPGSAYDEPPRKVCEHCQRSFIPSGPGIFSTYCSSECYIGHTGSDPEYDPDDCPTCKAPMVDHGTYQRCDYCDYEDYY